MEALFAATLKNARTAEENPDGNAAATQRCDAKFWTPSGRGARGRAIQDGALDGKAPLP